MTARKLAHSRALMSPRLPVISCVKFDACGSERGSNSACIMLCVCCADYFIVRFSTCFFLGENLHARRNCVKSALGSCKVLQYGCSKYLLENSYKLFISVLYELYLEAKNMTMSSCP